MVFLGRFDSMDERVAVEDAQELLVNATAKEQ
jgi:hypothetical protein